MFDGIGASRIKVGDPRLKTPPKLILPERQASATCHGFRGAITLPPLNSSSQEETQLIERKIIARYGCYEDKDEVTSYAQELLRRVAGDGHPLKIFVTKHWDAVNTMVLANGTIIISDRLFALCEYEEEIEFVLGHEIEHLRQGHVNHMTRDDAANPFAHLALERVQEWAADLSSFVRIAEDRGINPYGGKVFLARLSQSGNTGMDVVHGRLGDRGLNMEMLAHAVDLPALSTKLNLIPSQIRRLVPTGSEQKLGNYRTLVSTLERETRIQAAEAAEPFEILEALSDLNARFIKNKTAKKEVGRSWTNDDFAVTESLIDAFERKFASMCGPEYSNKETLFMLAAVLFLEAGIDTFREEAADPCGKLLAKINQELSSETDYLEMLNLYSRRVLNEMGFTPIFNQELFMTAIVEHALKKKVFAYGSHFIASYFRFLEACSDKFLDFFESYSKKVYFNWLLMGLAWIDVGSQLKAYLAEAEKAFGDRITLGFLRTKKSDLPPAVAKEIQTMLGERIKESGLESHIYGQLRKEIEGFRDGDPVNKGSRIKLLATPYLRQIENLSLQETIDSWRHLMEYFNAEKEAFDYFEWEDFVRSLFGCLFEALMEKECDCRPIDKFMCILNKFGLNLDAYVLPDYWWQYDFGAVNFKDLQSLCSIFMRIKEMNDFRLKKPEETKFFVFLLYQLRRLMATCEKADFIKNFIKILRILGEAKAAFFNLEMMRSHFSQEREWFNVRTFANEFLYALFSSYRFNLLNYAELGFLYEISYLVEDGHLALQLREKVTGLMSYADKKRVLIEDPRLLYSSSLAAKEEFIDHEVRSLADLREIETIVEKQLKAKEPDASTGAWLVGECLFELWQRKAAQDNRGFFKRLMETYDDDSELRSDLLVVRLLEGGADKADSIAASMRMVDNDLAAFYQLGPIGTHALVRVLLVGENGLLQSKEGRIWLLNYIFDKFVKKLPGRTRILIVLKRALKKMAEVGDMETLFFFLSPFIEKRILKPPREIMAWEKIFRKHGWVVRSVGWHNFWEGIKDRFRAKPRTNLASIARNQSRRMKREIYKYPGLLPDIMEAYGSFHVGGNQDGRLKAVGQQMDYEQKLVDLIGRKAQGEKEDQAVDPMKIVLECAGALWSLGTRFLQVFGQSVKLHPADEEDLSSAYDNMHGQFKWASSRVLRREWSGFEQEVIDFGEPIGGGSLMRAYRIKTRENGDEAVKVLNPNAEYFLDKIYALLIKVAEELAAEYGKGYQVAVRVLVEIKEWIARDINFAGFLAKDKVFYEQNQGWKPAGFRYAVRVPKSYGVDSKYYKREEYIKGLNLTKMKKLQAQGHDLKQVVALLVWNYLHQVKQGLVHSDVHIGNFRVVENAEGSHEHEVAILDRNFFLELQGKEQALFLHFMEIISGSRLDADRLASDLCECLSIDPQPQQREIARQIRKLMLRRGTAVDLIKNIMQLVSRDDIAVPLSLTLFVKNLNAFQKMARLAGFKNLTEAFSYVP